LTPPDAEQERPVAGRGLSGRGWLAGILLVGAVLRGAIVLYADRHPGRFDFPDTLRYLRVARHIAAGDGPMESEKVRAGTDPLYPAILAAGIRLGVETDAGVIRFGRLVNAVMGTASILLVARLGRRVATPRAALVAGAIQAVDPILLFFTGLVLTESCYLTLLLASACLLASMGGRHGGPAAAGAGLCLGLATLARSSSLALPLALVPAAWHFSGGPAARRAARCALLLAVSMAVLAPVMIRHHRLFGRALPTRTGSGASLLEGLGPWADGGPGMERIVYPPVPAGSDEAGRDAIFRRVALDWAREHPGDVLRLAWAKFRRTWSISMNAPAYSSLLYDVVCWVSVAPVFLLAALGVGRWPGAAGARLLLLAPAVYFTLAHMVFIGSVRYRLPAMPFLFILAGAAADRLLRSTARPAP
jgi:hypothetical protein